MSYVTSTPTICYYVNLNTYTKGKFGYTDFKVPLSDPIIKTKVSYDMNNYNSLSNADKSLKEFNYALFDSAYNKPICEICSVNDCK